eukprot:3732209-Rhodomonas_salina.1
MSTSAPGDQAALIAPTPAKSQSICCFSALLSKLESTRLAEQKLKDAKRAGLVVIVPKIRSAGAHRALKSRLAEKKQIKEIAMLRTKLSQAEKAAAEQIQVVVTAPVETASAEQPENDGRDVMVGTRNDGLRVLVGRKCLLA